MKKLVLYVLCGTILLTGCSQLNVNVPHENITPEKYDSYESVVVEDNTYAIDSEGWYETLCDSLHNYKNNIVISGYIDKNSVKSAVLSFNTDLPDVFWIDSYVYSSNTRKTELEFKLIEGCTEENIASMHDELEKAADRIISEVPEDSTDYEKILFVHDYIADHTVYDDAGAASPNNGLWGTSYGCLVNGSAICQGYAEAFVYITRKLGFESGVCSGDTYRGRHAWNYIKLDGEYYWIDVTWDDPSNEENDSAKVSHDYFLFNDELMSRTRKLDKEQPFAPKCTATDMNYYIVNNSYFDKYDIYSIGELVAKNYDRKQCEMMFSSFEAYNEAIDKMINQEEIWTAMDYVGYVDGISYSRNDRMFALTINF